MTVEKHKIKLLLHIDNNKYNISNIVIVQILCNCASNTASQFYIALQRTMSSACLHWYVHIFLTLFVWIIAVISHLKDIEVIYLSFQF